MGPGFIKVCAYAPYPVKIWLNGHEAVRRMAAAAGVKSALRRSLRYFHFRKEDRTP